MKALAAALVLVFAAPLGAQGLPALASLQRLTRLLLLTALKVRGGGRSGMGYEP